MELDNKTTILPPKRYFTKSYPQGDGGEKRGGLRGFSGRKAAWVQAGSGAAVALQGVLIQPVAAVAGDPGRQLHRLLEGQFLDQQ